METQSPTGVSQEKLAEVINAVVFESGILGRIVDQHLEAKLKAAAVSAVQSYVSTELGKVVEAQVSKVVSEQLNSNQVKELIDSKFRAITLYMKTDVIPKAVKQLLKQAQQA